MAEELYSLHFSRMFGILSRSPELRTRVKFGVPMDGDIVKTSKNFHSFSETRGPRNTSELNYRY